ncbi:MAG TPA: sigma-70 family RNA polymerase sigma factor [Gemmataceae bacterium]|jgi:RNA polymerase sigma factor (sigma-70 family)|nr:sigma-70 family RNA polymerase sigma factor [Gemmataceae bacterium]
MEVPNTEFESLLQQARAGNQEAARRLCEEHTEKLRRTVRRYLHRKLRQQFESDDFLQSVWGSFFAQSAEPGPFRTPEELERYLCGIARNKVIDTGRKRQTEKHGAAAQREWTRTAEQAALSREPTPSQEMMAEERWEEICAPLPPMQQEMLDLMRQGYTYREISERYNIHPKVIQRLLHCLLKEFEA